MTNSIGLLFIYPQQLFEIKERSRKLRPLFLVCAMLIWPGLISTYAMAGEGAHEQAADIPHVGKKARDEYLSYKISGTHRAYAIAPGGAWGWITNQRSEQEASREALSSCEQHTTLSCILYAVNDQVVFDEDKWAGLWGPYLNSGQADQRRFGRQVGERLFNLTFLDEKGKPQTLTQLRGKVVLVHFWGSWCPSCLEEFPSLLKLYNALKTEFSEQVAMVLLQVHESYDVSRKWADDQGFSALPLFNSMNDGSGEEVLKLSDGSTLPDRYLAQVFPSSYVIDPNGIVVFTHNGAINNWEEYLPFFRHVAESVN